MGRSLESQGGKIIFLNAGKMVMTFRLKLSIVKIKGSHPFQNGALLFSQIVFCYKYIIQNRHPADAGLSRPGRLPELLSVL